MVASKLVCLILGQIVSYIVQTSQGGEFTDPSYIVAKYVPSFQDRNGFTRNVVSVPFSTVPGLFLKNRDWSQKPYKSTTFEIILLAIIGFGNFKNPRNHTI